MDDFGQIVPLWWTVLIVYWTIFGTFWTVRALFRFSEPFLNIKEKPS